MWRAFLAILLAAAAALAASPAAASVPALFELPRLFTVTLDRGDTLKAVSIQPAPFDMVRVTDASGSFRFLSAGHVRSIQDDSGADLTREAIDRRRTIGTPPPRAEPWSGKRGSPPRRYGPRAVTKSFGITELAMLAQSLANNSTDRSYAISFDAGRAFNLGARYAVGGSLFVAGGDEYADVGVRGRFRRWLGPEMSVDVIPGIILAHDEPYGWHGEGRGFIGQVAFHPVEIAGVAVQVYSVRRAAFQSRYARTPPQEQRDTGVMVGFKIGGKPGLIGGIGAGVITFINGANMSPDVY